MATIKKSTTPFLLFLLFLLPCLAAAALGRKVGGRTQVKNVKENKEIQDLGKYCVHEYNRQQQSGQANGSVPAAKLLVFSAVVEAETQVVSGIKYYLKISAATHGGGVAEKTFEAVVVVKPWTHSKKLLNFEPSPDAKNTK